MIDWAVGIGIGLLLVSLLVISFQLGIIRGYGEIEEMIHEAVLEKIREYIKKDE